MLSVAAFDARQANYTTNLLALTWFKFPFVFLLCHKRTPEELLLFPPLFCLVSRAKKQEPGMIHMTKTNVTEHIIVETVSSINPKVSRWTFYPSPSVGKSDCSRRSCPLINLYLQHFSSLGHYYYLEQLIMVNPYNSVNVFGFMSDPIQEQMSNLHNIVPFASLSGQHLCAHLFIIVSSSETCISINITTFNG